MALSNIGVTEGLDALVLVDDIGGTGYPISKMMLGGAGVNDGLVDANNPVPMTIATNHGGPLFDAFGRLRFSQPLTLFDSKLIHDKGPLFWDENIVNASTNATSIHSTTHARVRMHVENGDTIIRQTKRRFNYQSGKSHLIIMTSVLGNNTTGVVKRLGYFDQNNGVFFEQDETALKVVVRKSGSDTAVSQTSWNIDKFDGNGHSGITLDETKAQIFIMDLEWLGVGRIRFGFVINGIIYYCHEVLNANNITSVYMSTSNNPLRYEISSTSGSDNLDQICGVVISEGGREEDLIGITRSLSNGTTHVNADIAGSGYALVGIRLKANHLDALVLPINIGLVTLTNDNINWKLCINPVLTSSLTYSDITNSAVQGSVGSSSHMITDYGTVIEEGYFYQRDTVSIGTYSSLKIGSTISGVRDELVLVAVPFSSNADVAGVINWREIV